MVEPELPDSAVGSREFREGVAQHLVAAVPKQPPPISAKMKYSLTNCRVLVLAKIAIFSPGVAWGAAARDASAVRVRDGVVQPARDIVLVAGGQEFGNLRFGNW